MKVLLEEIERNTAQIKREVEEMQNNNLRNAWILKKELLYKDLRNREVQYLVNLNNNHEAYIKRKNEVHGARIQAMSRDFLEKRRERVRHQNKALWEMEKAQMKAKYELRRDQIKQSFALQEQHMSVRHAKELEHQRRISARKEILLLRRQAAERRALPKRMRNELQIREITYRESLRIHSLPEPTPVNSGN